MYEEKIISLDSYCMDVPALGFAAWLVQEPYEGEFPNLFPNLLRLSPNFSPNQPHLSPNFHCFHMDGNCYNEPQIAVDHFKKLFQIHIIYTTRINFVINPSKDWPFNQILACLWSFFEHISICFDKFL